MTKHDIRKGALRAETVAIHGGRDDLADVHAPPIDLSTTYPVPNLGLGGGSLWAMANGERPQGSPVYGRLHNPTVARFEDALAALEVADEAVAFASGMAATTAVLMAASERGKHVVAVRPVYGGTDHLLASGMLGLEVTWAEPEHIDEAIRPDTCLVIVETPANPTLHTLDIEEVVSQAGHAAVMVDSTFATPVLQQPLRHGAALSLHSATKYLGGHGDVVGGVVATDAEWARALRRVRVATGALLHPLGGYLLHRGLQTLPLRVRAAQETAMTLADRLADHPAVARVLYPGRPGGDRAGVVGRQMLGPGCMLSFEVERGLEPAEVMAGLELVTPAVSLGSTDTLIQHPASLTHRVVDPEARRGSGVSDALLRLSVGLEHVEDLWTDLDRALRAARRPRRRTGPSRAGDHEVYAR